MKRIFVYGTLRKGMYNYDTYLKSEDTFRQYAYVKGSLFTIQGKVYPALLLEGQDMIIGEIHEVSDETMIQVDKMEGYISPENDDNEYDVILCDIYDERHQVIDHLPVYVFNMRNKVNAQILGDPIECLDYVQFISKK